VPEQEKKVRFLLPAEKEEKQTQAILRTGKGTLGPGSHRPAVKKKRRQEGRDHSLPARREKKLGGVKVDNNTIREQGPEKFSSFACGKGTPCAAPLCGLAATKKGEDEAV